MTAKAMTDEARPEDLFSETVLDFHRKQRTYITGAPARQMNLFPDPSIAVFPMIMHRLFPVPVSAGHC
jgi:hypothetical protein